MTQKIRVATYIRGAVSTAAPAWSASPRALEAIDADIVALQEVVSREGFAIENHQEGISRSSSDTFTSSAKPANTAEGSTAT